MRVAGAILVAALSAAASAAEPSVHATGWLIQASEAARQANYQGVVVYRDARVMEVLRTVHNLQDMSERPYTLSLIADQFAEPTYTGRFKTIGFFRGKGPWVGVLRFWGRSCTAHQRASLDRPRYFRTLLRDVGVIA